MKVILNWNFSYVIVYFNPKPKPFARENVPVIWPTWAILFRSAESAQIIQPGSCGDRLAPSDRVEVIWDFACPKEMTESSEKAIIECQECFPISFHNSAAPRSRWDKLKCQSCSFFFQKIPPGPDKPQGWRMSEGYANTQGYSESIRNQIDKKKKHIAIMLYCASYCCLPRIAIPKRDWEEAWKWYWWSLEFSRWRARGPEFLVELKQKCWKVRGQKTWGIYAFYKTCCCMSRA